MNEISKVSRAVVHAYPGIANGFILSPSTSSVKETELRHLVGGGGRDILILRPDVADEVKKEAIARVRKMIGKRYSKKDMYGSGLFPSLAKGLVKDQEELICSGLVAHAYPGIDFRPGKSQRVVRPSDIHHNSKMKEIVSYSMDGKDDGLFKDASLIAGLDTLSNDTPSASSWKELESYLLPGDLVLTKASKKYKDKLPTFKRLLGNTGLYGGLARAFNQGERWGHIAMYVGGSPESSGEEVIMSKTASMIDMFVKKMNSRPDSEMVTRKAVVRPNLAKGIETRKSLGIDKDRSNSNKANSRNKNLIDIFS